MNNKSGFCSKVPSIYYFSSKLLLQFLGVSSSTAASFRQNKVQNNGINIDKQTLLLISD